MGVGDGWERSEEDQEIVWQLYGSSQRSLIGLVCMRAPSGQWNGKQINNIFKTIFTSASAPTMLCALFCVFILSCLRNFVLSCVWVFVIINPLTYLIYLTSYISTEHACVKLSAQYCLYVYMFLFTDIFNNHIVWGSYIAKKLYYLVHDQVCVPMLGLLFYEKPKSGSFIQIFIL